MLWLVFDSHPEVVFVDETEKSFLERFLKTLQIGNVFPFQVWLFTAGCWIEKHCFLL
jgi:hypothetical protein